MGFGVAGGFLVCFGLPLQTPIWVRFFGHRQVGWCRTVGCVCVMRGVAPGLRPSLVSAHDASRELGACLASAAWLGFFVRFGLGFGVFSCLTCRSKGRAARWRF